MENAISVVEYKVKVLKKDLNLENTNDKIKFLNAIAKTLSEVDNTMEREVYVSKIAKSYDISEEAIYAEINKLLYKNTASIKTLEKVTTTKQTVVVNEKILPAIEKREKLVIYLLINYPKESFESIFNSLTIECIKSELNKKIIEELYVKISQKSNLDNVLNWFEDDETINYISGILAYDFEITDVNKAIDDIVKIYSKENKINERNTIIKELENKNLSLEDKKKLEEKLSSVIIELAKMK